MSNGPRVLFFDIETAPILAYCWGLFDQTIGLNQVHTDWFILSWAAKWLGEPSNSILHMDQRNRLNIEDDTLLLKGIWSLLDDADIVVTQNGKSFDSKKLNTRFVSMGFGPPSSYKHIDIYLIAKKHFAFTSNKLEYLSKKLNVKYTKQSHHKFSGFELWRECLKGNISAWVEMEKYNKYDVLALEELYHKLIPWDNSLNFNLWNDSIQNKCNCGCKSFINKGYFYTATGKFSRYKCTNCKAELRGRKNLFDKEKRQSIGKIV